MKGLLYATNMKCPTMVQLPVFVDYDDALDATGWVADVSTAHWFPRGATYTKIEKLPGLERQLENCYTIVTSANAEYAPPNKCMLARLGLSMCGNVIVLRHARRQPMRVSNMHYSERQFVDALLMRYADSHAIRVVILGRVSH